MWAWLADVLRRMRMHNAAAMFAIIIFNARALGAIIMVIAYMPAH